MLTVAVEMREMEHITAEFACKHAYFSIEMREMEVFLVFLCRFA